MAVHGDVLEIAVSHPDLGNRRFDPKANEGNTFNPGGFVNSDDDGGITSSGELIITKNRVRGFFSVMIEDDQNVREDALFIKELAGSSESAVWTISLVNGTVWQGSGVPVGPTETELNTGMMTLKVVSGNWRKIQ